MSFHVRIVVRPDIGTFPADAFTDLLQREVLWPGLDPAYKHTLLDAQVEPDGSCAELMVLSEPVAVLRLDRSLRTVGVPPAYVKALDSEGTELHAGPHARPLQVGETVAIGEDHYTVSAESWPGRDPVSGCCTGDIDWQYAVLTPSPRPSMHPVAAE